MANDKELIRYKRAYNAACDYLSTKDDAPKKLTWQEWFLSLIDELFGKDESDAGAVDK